MTSEWWRISLSAMTWANRWWLHIYPHMPLYTRITAKMNTIEHTLTLRHKVLIVTQGKLLHLISHNVVLLNFFHSFCKIVPKGDLNALNKSLNSENCHNTQNTLNFGAATGAKSFILIKDKKVRTSTSFPLLNFDIFESFVCCKSQKLVVSTREFKWNIFCTKYGRY